MFEIGIPSNFSIYRLFSLLLLLILLDSFVIRKFFTLYSVQSTFYTWALFEGVTLLISALASLCKLQLNLVDIRLHHGLPNKPVLIFYVDLADDLLQMLSYCVFMLLFVLTHPGRLPLYAISDFANVARQLIAKLKSFRRYRQLTRNMQHAFRTPTTKDCLDAGDCIICRDPLVSEASVAEEEPSCKKLACSHIYHGECLKNWLLMQQTCPTCRAEIRPQTVEPHQQQPQPQPQQPQAGEAVGEEDGAAFAELREEQPGPLAAGAAADVAAAAAEEGESRRTSDRTEVSVTTRRGSGGSFIPTPSQQMLITHALAMRDYYRQQTQFWRDQLKGEEPPGNAPGSDVTFD